MEQWVTMQWVKKEKEKGRGCPDQRSKEEKGKSTQGSSPSDRAEYYVVISFTLTLHFLDCSEYFSLHSRFHSTIFSISLPRLQNKRARADSPNETFDYLPRAKKYPLQLVVNLGYCIFLCKGDEFFLRIRRKSRHTNDNDRIDNEW